MKKPDFEQMTNKEIAELYKNSREEYANQRNKNQATQGENALVVGDDRYWKDDRGYVHEGVKPQPRASNGFDEDMLVPEWQDRNKTPIDKLTDWANANLNDQQIAALLPQEAHVVLARCRNYEIGGSFENNEWHLRAVDIEGSEPDIRFRMPGTLDQDAAAVHARNYVQNELALRLRELSQGDINYIQRVAPTNRELAVGLFLRSRLPSRFEKELNKLLAEAEITGNNTELIRFMSSEDINPVAEEALLNVWSWANPHVDFTEELQAFFQQRTANTVVTFALLDKLYSQYQFGRAVALTSAPPPVSEAGLNDLPDDQVTDLFNRTRVEYARSRS